MSALGIFLYRFGDLIGIALPIAALVLLITLILRVRFIRRLAVGVITFIPAVFLLMMSAWAVVFWRPFQAIVRRVVPTAPITEALLALMARVGRVRGSPLPSGDRLAFAMLRWPEERYPFLYRPVPADIERPLYEDGVLVGGEPVTWLADRHMTASAIQSAVVIAITSAFIVFFPPVIYGLVDYATPVLKTIFSGMFEDKPILEFWPGTEPLRVGAWLWWKISLENLSQSVGEFFSQAFQLMGAWATFSIGVVFLSFIVAIDRWRHEKSAPYRLKTKDADVRWPYRAELRNVVNDAYNRQVLLADTYLKGSTIYSLGLATGFVRARGDLTAPLPGQTVALDSESLFQHLLVLGGTGEGKTMGILKPLMEQIMPNKRFGMFISDAKGTLCQDAIGIAKKAGREQDIRVIGTGPNQYGVNPLINLSPTQVAAVLRSVLRQTGGASSDSFWPDMAVLVVRHALTVGYAFARTPAGENAQKSGLSPYSLWWTYQAVLNEDLIAQAHDAVVAHAEEIKNAGLATTSDEQRRSASATYKELISPEYNASIEYLGSTWKDMAKDTKTGIIANITQLLDGFSGTPILRERFACGRTEGTLGIHEALAGKLVVTALSSIEDGLPARLVMMLLKTSLYRAARLREALWKAAQPPQNPQHWPCVVMMDEVQELVTVDPTSGLSDATFWNVARSAGLAGIFATQTIAALIQAMGEEAANNFLQQARSKIFFRSEDRATIDYACWCAGEFERNRVFEELHRESIDHRVLIDGWTPFLPIDEGEEIVGGPAVFFQAAKALLMPEAQKMHDIQHARTYNPDMRFLDIMPKGNVVGDGAALNQQLAISRVQMLQQAFWRAEDLERQYKTTGNEMRPALAPSDIVGMGRWHAFAHVQRAGVARQDIIAVTHIH